MHLHHIFISKSNKPGSVPYIAISIKWKLQQGSKIVSQLDKYHHLFILSHGPPLHKGSQTDKAKGWDDLFWNANGVGGIGTGYFWHPPGRQKVILCLIAWICSQLYLPLFSWPQTKTLNLIHTQNKVYSTLVPFCFLKHFPTWTRFSFLFPDPYLSLLLFPLVYFLAISGDFKHFSFLKKH